MKNYGNEKERLREDLKTGLAIFPKTTYDMEGLLSQRAGCDYLRQHPELLPTDPDVQIYKKEISVPGNEHLNIRIYTPANQPNACAGILWIHGGGMCIGITESDDGQNIRLAKEVPAVVVSVEYRLAPEFPYPIPGNDCYGALVWFYEHAHELHVNPEKIAVAGSSGGGGLTLSIALRARDCQYPPIAYLMPLTPMISRNLKTESAKGDYDPRTLNAEGIALLWSHYLGNIAATDVYMEPAKGDFNGLPAVYTFAGELDPFRDETILLAQKLMACHVPVELHIFPGCCHVFDALVPNAPISRYAVSEMIRALQDNLATN